MDPNVEALFAARAGADREEAYRALVALFELTERPVDWAYEVWDRLTADLASADAHERAFAAQLLARLAISDPEQRMLRDFPAVFAITRDEKFVTARHALQNVWRVGLAGPAQALRVVDALAERFHECGSEKNGALIRTDIVAALRQLHDALGDAAVSERAEALMAGELDEAARKKQRAAWRKAGTR